MAKSPVGVGGGPGPADFGGHPQNIKEPFTGISRPTVYPYPFLRPGGTNVGYSAGNRSNIKRSFLGQAGVLARNTFYRFAQSQGMNNPAADQVEQGYTQPIQSFINPATPAMFNNFPQPTDNGSNVRPGIKTPVPTSGISTGMPWQVV